MVAVVQAGLACCGVEAAAVNVVGQAEGLSGLDPDVLGRILVVAGTVTGALAPVVREAYERLAEPRVVVAFGACAISGGPYWDSYSVLPGASSVVPVDVMVPGCPPSPEDLAAALVRAAAGVTA
jgi:NADH-quinone oxidoreductase subunit B